MSSAILHSPTARLLRNGKPAGSSASVLELAKFMEQHPKSLVITGAGISSGSGIPTYRDDSGTWKSNRPIQHAEFMRSHSVRQRYWARSFSGWPTIDRALPNSAHMALAKLEKLQFVSELVTQNVDRLHQQADHSRVIDLHGRLDQVLCMDCGATIPRAEVQQWLQANNPKLREGSGLTRPDGDADVDDALVATVKVPSCERCDGLLKPNVVFYGSSVAKDLVASIYEKISKVDLLLVVGSSLTVFSSYRFCKFAFENSVPIACINQGLTRADELFELKIANSCGDSLEALVSMLQS